MAAGRTERQEMVQAGPIKAPWPHGATRVALAGVFLALAALRLPSLVEPAGADQGLYAYIGSRIADGELPYRDAWDQKPPAIHYTYALLHGLWPSESVVAAADLAVAIAVAWMLIGLGRCLHGPAAGWLAGLIFLAFANPAFTRLGGVRTRAQCETFIAAAVTAALVAVARRPRAGGAFAAGALLGLAFLYKFNALVYVPVAALAAVIWPIGRRDFASALAGLAAPATAAAAVFWSGGALDDLWHATVTYNLRYSGETYATAGDFIRYLLAFPVGHARVDALWLLGGAACAVLLVRALAPAVRDARSNPGRDGSLRALLPVVWVAAACLSIAINGRRGLPQYFVQAAPGLALAAGAAGAIALTCMRPVARVFFLGVVVVAALRVSDVAKVTSYLAHDIAYLRGATSASDHLDRFGGYEAGTKFSARAVRELGDYLGAHSGDADRVLIFGFSGGAYVRAGRRAASRFFWSRPVVVEFNAGAPGYGPLGLLDDLARSRPPIVALERNDEGLDAIDSATYFMSQPALKAWLEREYARTTTVEDYVIWTRR